MPIPPERAAAELSELRSQVEKDDVQRDGPEHDRWRQSVDAVMANSLPAASTTLQELRNMRYHIGFYTRQRSGWAGRRLHNLEPTRLHEATTRLEN
jgi:hypothetical protein